MSLEATQWAWGQSLTPMQKLVLLSLSDRAGKDAVCYPSVQRLEADTGMNRKTIMEAIKALEGFCLLTVDRGLGRGNIYKLNLEEKHITQDHKAVPKTVPVPKLVLVPETVLDQYQKRDLTSTKNGTLIYQEPIKNLKDKKKLNFNNLPKEISQDIAKEFIKHRAALKAPLTQHAFDLAMKESLKAINIGLTPDQAINETISAGWKAIKIEWLKNRANNEINQSNRTNSSGGNHNAKIGAIFDKHLQQSFADSLGGCNF